MAPRAQDHPPPAAGTTAQPPAQHTHLPEFPRRQVSPYEINTWDWEDARRCPVETVVDEEVARTRIIGCSSSYGWAVTVDDDTWAMYLLDPFTGRSFRLPPLTDPLPPVDQRRSEEEPRKAKEGFRPLLEAQVP